jgi:tetratricopeptide (TPR) repeat protein
MGRAAAMLAALLCAGVAWAQVPLPLDPLPRTLYQEARSLEEGGDLLAAARRYEAVLRHDPRFVRAVMDLGRVREAIGDLDGAAEAYQLAPPDDVDALEALGKVYDRQGRAQEAAATFRTLRVYKDWSSEPIRLEAHATAGFDPDRAVRLYRTYLGAHDLERDARGAAETASRIAEALVEAGEGEAAFGFLEEILGAYPALEQDERFSARLDRLRIEERARRLSLTAAQPLTADQRTRLDGARAAFAAGQVADARALLDTLMAENDRNPEVWAALADVHEAQGDVAASDQALQMAQALAPFEPRYPARLGDLLATRYGGTQDAEAAASYERALRLDPTWAELWLRKARMEQRSGDWEAAERSYRRYAALEPDGPFAEEALAEADGVHRTRPPKPVLSEAPRCPPEVSVEGCRAFYVAAVLHVDGRIEEALEELDQARAVAPLWSRPLNLEANIRLQAGQGRAAISLYEQSLALDPSQEALYLLLWELWQDEGDERAAHEVIQRAQQQGVGISYYLKARQAWERWRPFQARDQLEAYFAAETSGRYHSDAQALRGEVDRFVWRLWLILVFGAAGLVFGVPGLLWWRKSGVGLEELLQRAPTAYRDVARVGSAIRHEVLKHNTTVLPAVADALDHSDPEPAWWAAEKLFGERGAVDRFREYVRELEVLGRMHGVRLNLRHRDPALGPLIAAVDQLQALSGDLSHGSGWGLADKLRDVSEALNERGYRALGALLRRVCLLRLDEGVFLSAWDQVVGEPEFNKGVLPELEVVLPEEPVFLRIYRGDLEDILVNVFRNSLAATLEATEPGRQPAPVGVGAVTETEWITGLDRVAIRIKDHAPARITTALIRSRYIERGLGLTVDLISRNGGSIHVEDEPEWSKAVVIRLQCAEEA